MINKMNIKYMHMGYSEHELGEIKPLLTGAHEGWNVWLEDGTTGVIEEVRYTDDGQSFYTVNGLVYDAYGNENYHAAPYPAIIRAEPNNIKEMLSKK